MTGIGHHLGKIVYDKRVFHPVEVQEIGKLIFLCKGKILLRNRQTNLVISQQLHGHMGRIIGKCKDLVYIIPHFLIPGRVLSCCFTVRLAEEYIVI